MAERIPTDEVERLLSEIVTAPGVEAYVVASLAADLLDARREIERLREAVRDAERAILGDGRSEVDMRLHEALAPLWAALSGEGT